MQSKYLITIIPLVLLAACAPKQTTNESTSTTVTTPATPSSPATSTTVPATEKDQIKAKVQPAKVTRWEIIGGMAARYNNKGWTASINWLQQGPNNYQLRLMGPIGSGTVLISKRGGMVTYQDGAKKGSSANAGQLLQEKTGINLPVDNLYYWVRGMAAPGGVQSEKRGSANQLVELNQDGYHIVYSGYVTVHDNALPSIIRLTGRGLNLKLIVKQWKV